MTELTAPAFARTVLITGASTGIGYAAARHLSAQGWTVFAGVRSDSDGMRLKEGSAGDLRPIKLDVAKAEQVEAAVPVIAAALGKRRLTGLVNNAGIAKMGPLGIQPLKDFEAHFAVNVFGMLRVTQARRAGSSRSPRSAGGSQRPSSAPTRPPSMPTKR